MKARAPILLVEDDQNDRVLIRRTLASAGFANLRCVETAEEALEYLARVGRYSNKIKYPLPALLLLDLKLPGMDGFELLKWIRGNPCLEQMPVVVLTSSSEVRDVKKAYALGANSFLAKPLELENASALFATVGTQLWKVNAVAKSEARPGRINDGQQISESDKRELPKAA